MLSSSVMGVTVENWSAWFYHKTRKYSMSICCPRTLQPWSYGKHFYWVVH